MSKYQIPELLEIVKTETSVRACIKRLGFSGTCHNVTFLEYVKENNIDISHFENYRTDPIAKFKRPEFLDIVKYSKSAKECFTKLGYSGGSHYNHFRNFVKENNIDISHFTKTSRKNHIG